MARTLWAAALIGLLVIVACAEAAPWDPDAGPWGRGNVRCDVPGGWSVGVAAWQGRTLAPWSWAAGGGGPRRVAGRSPCIAYVHGDDVWLCAADGTDPRNVSNRPGSRCVDPDWSPDSRWLAFVRDDKTYRMKPDGSEARSVARFGWNLVRVSPNGRRCAAVSKRTGGFGIYTFDFPGGRNERRLATCASPEHFTGIAWSRDSRSLAYATVGGGDPGIYVVREADQQTQRVGPPHMVVKGLDWSADGRTLALAMVPQGLNSHTLWLMDADGQNLRRIPGTGLAGWNEVNPSWVDGGRILYAAVRGNRGEIWQCDVRSGDRTQLLTGLGGETYPRLSPGAIDVGGRAAPPAPAPGFEARGAAIHSYGADAPLRLILIDATNPSSVRITPMKSLDQSRLTLQVVGRNLIGIHATDDPTKRGTCWLGPGGAVGTSAREVRVVLKQDGSVDRVLFIR